MKEIMAIVRLNKVNETKTALAAAGFPAFTCRKVMGRGKKAIDVSLFHTILEEGELPMSPVGEYISEASRLIPKRVFALVVPDDSVEIIVNTIMDVNSTGNPGDGKIFVLPIYESIRVRDGEHQTDTDSY
ncbi:P-II family nitrogen regulator [Anaeromicropila populeti]|uniref:Nitrogen regulatory protein P-II family n=1 Tax=Anaeromicropila populeti TaxID=37658 RepID=A0A1I6HV67_9FIRM|nr:P-II family nitrogen regulator [Anaeromicropila populeti]SFR58346.1 nitrogen regulatory protein P-II family [Anaeromicropila populeti]